MRNGLKNAAGRAAMFAAFFLLCSIANAETARDQQLQTPEEFAGFPIGSDGNLVRWEKIVEYLQAAGQASDRILVQELGRTTLDNPFLLAIVSSPENLVRLDEIQANQRRLAYPYDLDEAETERLAWNSPAVLLITLNIHSTEIGSSQMALELIHQLATEESAWIDQVLDHVVFLLVPSLNPDGQIMVTDWYNKVKGTEHETASMPWIYHHYTGHDNNRDAFMLTQKESRLITKVLYQDWFPQVYLDEHQMGFNGARIFVPPWTNPINPNVDPIIWAENGLLGFALFTALHENGKSGVIYDQSYTSWWQGGFVMEAWWHNTVGLLTEVASVRVASPIEQEKAKLGVPPRGPSMSRRELMELLEKDPKAKLPAPRDVMPRNNYPRPWLGGKWTLRDIVDYELIATHALLESVANNRVTLIRNQVRMGRTAIEAGKKGKPYAYIFPQDQHDTSSLYRLMEILDYAGVEVEQASETFQAGEKEYPAGTYVIRMDQPFRAYVKDVLEVQKHPNPKDFPPGTMRDQPYDVTGWTLPLQMGVKSVEADKPFEAHLNRLESIPLPEGEFTGEAGSNGYLVEPGSNYLTIAANRLLKSGAEVYWLTGKARDGDRSFPEGTLIVQGAQADQMRRLSQELGLHVHQPAAPVDAGRMRLKAPRVGLYQPWTGSMDEGWTRWLLEQYEFDYTTLHNEDIRKGSLRDSLDAIVLPADRNKQQVMEGNSRKTTPEEYRGGIGEEGLAALEEFVRAGGTLVLMHDGTEVALDSWPLPVKNILKGVPSSEFSCPGSLLQIQVNPRHPVAYGMPEKATAVFSNSPAFDVAPGFGYTDLKVIARYPAGNPLQSGWMRGASHIQNRIAAAEVGYDEGRIILIGFRPQFRAQPHNTFKLLFNALHYSAAEGISRQDVKTPSSE